MGSITDVEQALPCSFVAKVHSVMCKELTKVVDRVTQIIPSIESARPGCNSGIQALCALYNAVEKAKFLLQTCAESSKLYLAIRGQSIQLRFEMTSKELDISLSKIEDMVPQPLAAEISDIVNDLRDAKFVMESFEEEAGRVLIALLEQDKSTTNSTEISEFEAFQFAALRLKLTSPKALLIEKRSIRKLLDRVSDTDQERRSILKNLLHLLFKYGELLGCEPAENIAARWKILISSTNSSCNSGPCENLCEPIGLKLHVDSGCSEDHTDVGNPDEPPEELRCPISSELMFDPVVIASGETYERMCIEKWFSEGHDTCPKTQKKLSHLSLTPNSCVKDLIANWCRKHNFSVPDPCSQPIPAAFALWNSSCSTSIHCFGSSINNTENTLIDGKSSDYENQNDIGNASISSSDASNLLESLDTKSTKSFNDGHHQIFSWYDGSDRCQSFADFSHEMYSNLLSKLATLPSEAHHKAVEDVKIFLKDNEEVCYSMNCNGFVEALMAFLINAREQSDIKAQKVGAQILLAFLSSSRNEMPPLNEDGFLLLASFLDSEMFEEALAIIQLLLSHGYCKPEIVASGILPSITKVLDSQVKEFLLQAVKIFCDLSSYSDIQSHILSSGCISKLIQLLGDDQLAGNCIRILQNLCDTEEARVAIAETNGCIASIVELIDAGTYEEQEHAVSVLLSLCSYSSDYCQLVMKEVVIPPLVSLSINGNVRGKESAMKLLLLLRDLRHNDHLDSSFLQIGSVPELSHDIGSLGKEKQPNFKTSSSCRRKLHIFLKHIFGPVSAGSDMTKAFRREKNAR
ncbi:U-box domain-containing protein 6-like [Magnolia sinica]|uniref:U-box domain-containing protein 6-like n=1 Tax=Magnolia sinica TaxID=86752 RepID=UPI0026596B06|nr:U-box domain-containing protein 6-like [Magnolia sinica]XP_058087095.1 U-box domain-containing protein 6-like [Magnolia sinica]XP_058087096.1 U-box domain-containing protein 6-like [Magnolia sinica]XP_058087097.1 U-box domain-containing protein 6-like [Magnolia sinica]XP_058087098.1 U-box domain-containing protein 6-like [Magnolia sinica]